MSSPGRKNTPTKEASPREEEEPKKEASPGEKDTPEKGAPPRERNTTRGDNTPRGKNTPREETKVQPLVSESSASEKTRNIKELVYSKDFLQWFWTGNNSKDLIIALNNYSPREDQFEGIFVRFEASPPQIYGIKVSDHFVDCKFWPEMIEQDLTLVKVGLTRREANKEVPSRVKNVENKLYKNHFTVNIMFCLKIDFTTLDSATKVEQDIRSKVGIEVDKNLASDLELPYPTEWVITSNTYIDSFERKIDGLQEQSISIITTKDIEACNPQSIEILVRNMSYVELKDKKVVLRTPTPTGASPKASSQPSQSKEL